MLLKAPVFCDYSTILKRYDRLEIVTKPYRKETLTAAAMRLLRQHRP